MANDAKKVSQTAIVTTMTSNDLVVILANTATLANNATMRLSSFASSLDALIHGPYANDAVAAAAGVIVGNLYYTALGTVQLRLT